MFQDPEMTYHRNWVRAECVKLALHRTKHETVESVINEAKVYENYIVEKGKKGQVLKLHKGNKRD
mgnify:CR=1 FL=1